MIFNFSKSISTPFSSILTKDENDFENIMNEVKNKKALLDNQNNQID